nr:MAG TPA: hypothetical protein [Caudoviricetes sp.]
MRRHFSSIVSHFANIVLASCILFSSFGNFLDNLVFRQRVGCLFLYM